MHAWRYKLIQRSVIPFEAHKTIFKALNNRVKSVRYVEETFCGFNFTDVRLHLCQVKFRNVQMIFRYFQMIFRFSKWISDVFKWDLEIYTCEFQIFPNEIKVVLIMNRAPHRGHQCCEFEHVCPHFTLILGPKE